jgi:glycosyltransferase involved in cell wall biosynthesis
MNICLLTKYFHFDGTGISRFAEEILKGLEKRGHTIYKIEASPTVSLYSYFFYTALEIPLKLPRKNIDVYHALVTLEGMWLPKDRSIVMIHDLFTTTDLERVGAGMGYSRWKKFIGAKYFSLGSNMASKCRFVVCNSEKTKQDILEHIKVSESKIKVIKLGISKDLEPAPKKDKVFRIGTLSQLDKRKRIDLLINQFRASKIDGELVVAGQGKDRLLLEKLINGDSRIKLVGFVPDSKMADFFNSLDIFAFPTWIEGLGLPIIEALSCRKPVVVLSDAIMPDEVKSRCIVVDNFTDAFKNMTHLENLIKLPNYNDNYRFAKGHSWDSCVESHIKLYQEIAG